jgi:hypothetical protein
MHSKNQLGLSKKLLGKGLMSVGGRPHNATQKRTAQTICWHATDDCPGNDQQGSWMKKVFFF